MTHITTTNVAVDPDYFWRPMKTCPFNVKVQLLNRGSVAIYGTYDGVERIGPQDWLGWCPLPKKPEEQQ